MLDDYHVAGGDGRDGEEGLSLFNFHSYGPSASTHAEVNQL